jgi:2-methylcitrate synthase
VQDTRTNEKPSITPGLAGVPVAKSSISYIDGTQGILEYRGYRIETLARESNFEEVCWLLLDGSMPSGAQLAAFRANLARHRQLPDRLVKVFECLPGAGHPMDAMQASIALLAMFDRKPDPRNAEEVLEACVRILAATPVMIATFERLRTGKDVVEPDPELDTAANFLWMLTGQKPDPLSARVFDVALLLHADHEMNASTFAARVVASTEANPYAVCSSAIGALHGPLHGGANEEVLAQLKDIGSPENVTAWLDAKQTTKGKVMGFGHRVYKVKDPRATILQGLARQVFEQLGTTPLYETALEVERQMAQRYGGKGIYPNVDFFSGFVYAKLGIPTDLFTPVFGISRVAGYLAHWREQMQDNKLFRPSQVYAGPHELAYPPLGSR